jgi:hypothetical protein
MPDTLDQINVTTRRYIDTEPKLADLVFNNDPLMSMLEENCLQRVGGGSSWNSNIEYDVQDGGAYSKGQDMAADQRQIEQQLRFDPKYQSVMIPFYKEDIKVLNVSGNMEAVVDLITERVDSAYMQLGAQTALQLYLQGQTGNYVKMLNGMQEAFTDGSTAGLTSDTFPTYGTLTRATYGGRMLAPAPINFAGGNITLPQIDAMYQSVNFGSGDYEPNVIMTTVKGFGYIRNNYQTQQRFQNVTVAKGGFRGLEYNGAVVMSGRYVPGSYLTANSGTNDKVAVRFFTWTTGGALTAYPTLSGLSTGESIWVLNVRKQMMKYRVSANRPFNGDLDDDGFIPSAGNTKIVGKILLAHNPCFLPGYGCYGYNFAG